MTRRKVAATAIVAALAISASLYGEKQSKASLQRMQESKRALHVLNRLTFGPRPGDVDRVATMGVDKWIEQQLHPENINDSALEARLAGFRTLKMDARAMLQNFPPPQVAKAVESGRRPLPDDPTKRAIIEAQMQRQQ